MSLLNLLRGMIQSCAMVQLEHAVKIDGIEYILIMSDEEADNIISNEHKLDGCKALYVSACILLTSAQQREISNKNIDIHIIPDYYFEEELLEVGER